MVIVATGAIRAAPSIPGADLDTVFSGDDLRRLMLGEDSEALSRKTGLGSRLIAKAAAVTGLSANIGLVRQATRQWMPLGMNKIGRASCRERVCQYVTISWVAGSLKKKKQKTINK